MEEYKRSLCWRFKYSTSEEEIYNNIKDDPSYTYNLNEDGVLHSTYNENHYEPAITYRDRKIITYWWLFNGEIKDCSHPFMIHTFEGQIINIGYYSLEKIQTNQPIAISYCTKPYCRYNMCFNYRTYQYNKILNDDIYKHGTENMGSIHCDINTTPECYPLWDEMAPRFKFAD